ncbi:MAG TPA: acyl-CoA dehydrogenase family protein [Alphaproteobacteria bacterium]|jgi:hypothetical protein|nr:acyl-CoA dehydrogenase family protein [Alphaproteobacteria bacterium]
MDLTPNPDQSGLLDSVGKLVASFRAPPPNTRETLLTSCNLDRQLREAGFSDIVRYEGMGPLDAVLVAETVHALPYSVEFIGSALLGGALDLDLTGPVALLEAPAEAPVRFLAAGSTALIADGDDIRILLVTADMVDPVPSPFAYPLGKLKPGVRRAGTVRTGAASALRLWWNVALAVEIGATAKAAVDLIVDYVKNRRQFGKPIGAYQAVQHRLSECTVAVHAIQTLARRAAALGTLEAALAASVYAKEACPRIIYDTHQFQGAIGVTYEYPLHFFTYRLRLLHGELGSLADSAERLATERWSEDDLDWSR